MSGAQGNALDWALALAKAPSERHALRQRALPEEIDTLMQIAGGGAAETVARSAARTGESPASIVEASRFYLREVLFFPEADAYRLLGVSNDAEQGRIRSHHRLLQQWLHPDRSSDEDAVFAARVNAAWDQVRQPDRRAAYDLSHPAPLAHDIASDAGYHPVRPWIPVTVPDVVEVPPQERWRRRVPLLMLLSACFTLGVITVRHQQTLDDPGSVPLAAPEQDDGPLLRDPRGKEVAAPVLAARHERPLPPPAHLVKRAPAPVAADMTRDDPFQPFVAVEDPEFAMPVEPERARPAAVVVDATPPARRTPPPTPPPAPITPPARTIAAVVPARGITAAAPARAVAVAAPVPPPVAVTAPVSAPVRQQRVAAAVPPPSPPARALPPAATAGASPKFAAPVVAAGGGSKVAPAAVAGGSPNAAPAAAASGSQKVASTRIPPPTAPDPRRVAGARLVGERLLAYLVETNKGVPPIWDSLSAERTAAHLRNGIARGDGPRFASPDWRISDTDASLQAGLRYRDGREGRVRARLTWREQRWLVSDLSMEQDW